MNANQIEIQYQQFAIKTISAQIVAFYVIFNGFLNNEFLLPKSSSTF